MKKANIIYWSGSGNTEMMANLIAEGAKSNGLDVTIKEVSEATVDDVNSCDVLALGCPAMGNEELEESEMEPFVESILGDIKDKKLALFGSYDWGDGEWMRNWEERMKEAGAELVQDGLIVNNAPESDEDREFCLDLGKKLNI